MQRGLCVPDEGPLSQDNVNIGVNVLIVVRMTLEGNIISNDKGLLMVT